MILCDSICNGNLNMYETDCEYDGWENGDDDWALLFGCSKEKLKYLYCLMVTGPSLDNALYRAGFCNGEDGSVVLSKKIGKLHFVDNETLGTIDPSNDFYVWAVAWANK